MTRTDDVREHLIAMRDYINKHGFCRDVGKHGGPRCYIGAGASVDINTIARSGKYQSISILNDEFAMLRRLVDPKHPDGAFATPRQNATEAMAILTTAIAMLPDTQASREPVREKASETSEA